MSAEKIEKLKKKYRVGCEKCGADSLPFFCGDCSGLQCEECFVEHLGECGHCNLENE